MNRARPLAARLKSLTLVGAGKTMYKHIVP